MGLEPFMNFYKPFQSRNNKSSKSMQHMKVAVLDNGFDAASLGSHVAQGQSFVYDNDGRECNWFFATDPHGTQMASTIIGLDPSCKLYLAKVGNGRKDFTVDAVVQVRTDAEIFWFRSQSPGFGICN
jgi:hypothetical protein